MLELAAEHNTRAGFASGLDALDWLQVITGNSDPDFVLRIVREFPDKKDNYWNAYFFTQRILSKLDDSRYKWSDGQKHKVLKAISRLADHNRFVNLQRIINNRLK